MRDDKLQEIIELLPYSIRYSGEIEELLDYAREQAERVDELEEKLHFCEMTKLSMDSVEKYTEQIKSKNKRYREALVRLRNDINKQETGYEKNVFVIKTVDDALIDWEALEGKK